MFRVIFTLLCTVLLAVLVGCGSSTPTNSTTAANANANANANTNSMSPVAVPPSTNTTPGIPANVTQLPKGATPTPGIPSPEELKKGVKPGVTPTPGIPSPAELRRQMGLPPGNVNAPVTKDVPMMKSTNRKLGGKPQ